MILCFIYGGISLVVFTYQVGFQFQSAFHRNRTVQVDGSAEIHSRFSNSTFPTPQWQTIRSFRRISINFATSILGIGAIISILAGVALYDLLKKEEKKELTKSLINTMTTPDEKLIIKALEESGGEMTQSELVKSTKLSKVKVHRIVKRLEGLEIVSKYPYGMTNKIKLEKLKEA